MREGSWLASSRMDCPERTPKLAGNSRRSNLRRLGIASAVEFFGDQLVEERGVGLAFGGAHHLADKKSGDGFFACAVLGDLGGISGDDLVDKGFDGVGVGDLLRLFALVNRGEVLALVEADVEELLELFGAELAVFYEVCGQNKAGERDGRLVEFKRGGFEASTKLAEQEIGQAAGAFGRARGGLELVGEFARSGEGVRVLEVEFVVGDHALAAGLGQLGHAGGNLGLPGGGDDERRQVRLGKIAIVVGLFLGAHGIGAAFSGVPEACFLADLATGFDDLDLALDLVFERGADEAKAVDVFDFDFFTEGLRAARHDADVGVTAKRTLFHVAVRNASVEENLLEAGEVFEGFVGGANVRLGDDLDQRRAAAVEIDVGVGERVSKSVVDALASVLFHVGAGDADALEGAVGGGRVNVTVLGDGLVELRNLVTLGRVGVKVVFAGKDGALANLAVERKASEHGEFDGLAIEHRQRAGQAETCGAHVGIGRGTVPVGAAAEGLGRGEKLDVDFETDDGFVFGEEVGGEYGCGAHDEILTGLLVGGGGWSLGLKPGFQEGY
uniref:NAD-specific glutamate dehydrogenase n=1 Tax=mine drainage metagenome TaxID=410659 RepID=E6PYF8_9ZZZZ